MMMSLFLDKSVNQFESNKENKHQKKEMTEEKHRSEFGSIQGYLSSRYVLTFLMVSDVTAMTALSLNEEKTVKE